MMEYGLTLKVVCETDASAGPGKWPRDVASAARVTWMRGCCVHQLCAEGVVENASQAWRAQRGRPGNKRWSI